MQLRREDLLSEEFRARDVPVCLAIAKDTVDTVHGHYFSSEFRSFQRYSCVVYLTGALIALAGILLGPKVGSFELSEASKSFGMALQVIRAIAPSLRLARGNLKKLERVIGAAERLSSTQLPWLIPGETLTEVHHNDFAVNVGSSVGNALTLADRDELGVTMPFGLDEIDDGPVRMMFTPAFDVHYWDQQILGLPM